MRIWLEMTLANNVLPFPILNTLILSSELMMTGVIANILLPGCEEGGGPQTSNSAEYP